MSDKTPKNDSTTTADVVEEAVTKFNRDFVLGAGATLAVVTALWAVVRKLRNASDDNTTTVVLVSDDVIDTDTSDE